MNYTRPSTWFSLAIRGEGKSSLLEHIGEKYLEHNGVILDLFGSRDGEGLAWLRSPHAKDKKILLLKGDDCSVDASFPVKHCDDLRLVDFETYDIIISASPLYRNVADEFFYAAKVTDLLYTRLHYNNLVYMICREAANLYYSRLKVDENQVFAKAHMIYMIREARHIGLALGLDSVRFYSIDIDVRSLADYIFLKSQGITGLPKDLKFLYSFVDPALFRGMRKDEIVVLTAAGGIGYGLFPEIPWHKQEGEDILREVGVDVQFSSVPSKKGLRRGSYTTIGDAEHVDLISFYVDKGLGMHKIHEETGRSTKTISDHIKLHNKAVSANQFCARCRRVRGEHSEDIAEKTRY